MADIDLAPAVEAVAAWQYDIDYAAPWTEETDESVRRDYRSVARAYLEVGGPVIVAQVRAQIAADIEAKATLAAAPPDPNGYGRAISHIYEAAAKIARGDA